MRRIAVLLAVLGLLGVGAVSSPALAQPINYFAAVYPPVQAAHQDVEYVWDAVNDCNNSVRLRLSVGVRNVTSTSVFVESVTVRYLPRNHAIRGGELQVYAAGPESQTFRVNDFNDGNIPVGRVTERRWTINRTMTLQDALALQVRKQIYPALQYEDTCVFWYEMTARFAHHVSECQDYTHGARKVAVCVRLYRAGAIWWGEGAMATNSGAVTMRLSSLRLLADGTQRSEMPEDVVGTGGRIEGRTFRVDLNSVPAGRSVTATLGFRMTWGDGTCYPRCSPPDSAFISVGSLTR